MPKLDLILPDALASTTTGATDPIRYYKRPAIGWLFRRRIAMGLEMVPELPHGARALEVGYAAGIVLYNLAPKVSELHGIDLDADPESAERRLKDVGIDARLVKGSVLDMRGVYEDNFFDLVVCFSVMEHLREPHIALAEIARVLRPGGIAIIGMPAVNRFMELGFLAIGFKGIEDHHITTPTQVWQLVKADPEHWSSARKSLPDGVPLSLALYSTFRFTKLVNGAPTFDPVSGG